MIWANGPRDDPPCPPLTPPSLPITHTSPSLLFPYTLPLPATYQSLPSLIRVCSSLSFATPKACFFPHLTSSADFSTLLLSAGSSLHLSLPRCAKWKLSQRTEVAIVTCHSNHSPSRTSCVHVGRGSGRPWPRSAAPRAGRQFSNDCSVMSNDGIRFDLQKLLKTGGGGAKRSGHFDVLHHV